MICYKYFSLINCRVDFKEEENILGDIYIFLMFSRIYIYKWCYYFDY